MILFFRAISLISFSTKKTIMIQITMRLSLVLVLMACSFIEAQTISSKIIDSVSKQPLPFVTVQFNKGGVITNEEGRFSLLLEKTAKPTDSLKISCLGYETLSKPLNQFKDSIIYLVPRAIELKSVIVSNKVFTAEEIIEKVKENIDKNYNFDLTKKRLFFRQSEHQNFSKTDYKLKKSSIDALNKPFWIVSWHPSRKTTHSTQRCCVICTADLIRISRKSI